MVHHGPLDPHAAAMTGSSQNHDFVLFDIGSQQFNDDSAFRSCYIAVAVSLMYCCHYYSCYNNNYYYVKMMNM